MDARQLKGVCDLHAELVGQLAPLPDEAAAMLLREVQTRLGFLVEASVRAAERGESLDSIPSAIVEEWQICRLCNRQQTERGNNRLHQPEAKTAKS